MSSFHLPVAYARSLLVIACLFIGHIAAAQQGIAPSIQICGGDQVVCLTDAFVELCTFVSIPENYEESIDSFQIDFADGMPPLSRPGTEASFQVEYFYDFSSFYGSCEFQRDRRFITLRTYINGSDRPVESIFPFTGQNPPRADFGNFPEFACAGEEVSIEDASCPTEELTSLWDFGDGTPPSPLPSHVYAAPGTYTVTLEASNDCARNTISRTITVVDLPTISAVPDSGFVAGYTEPYLVCLSGAATVKLDGSASVGFNSLNWTASPGGGVTFEGARGDIARATFTRAGSYTISLTGRNEFCNSSVRTSFEVEVRQADRLRLTPQDDACISLDYCPSPRITGATYTLNGNPLDGCEEQLGVGTYVLEAFLPDEICGDKILRDTFRVLPPDISSVITGDLILCDLSDPVLLEASPSGGEWTINGIPFNGTFDPALIGPGEYTVGYGREPCLRTDEISITVRSSVTTVPPDTTVCAEGGAVTFTADPSDGTFSGPGITPAGVFDPGLAGVGTFTLRYRRDDAEVAACGRVDSFQVTVTALAVDFVQESCAENERCFALSGNVPYDEIRWVFPGGDLDSVSAPCYTFPGPGTYPVQLTVTLGGCRSTATREITIAPAPLARFTLEYDDSTCGEQEVTIVNESEGTGVVYEWMLNGLTFSNDPNPGPFTPTASTSASDTTHTISLQLSDGCTTITYSDTLVVITPPVAGFGLGELIYCSGDTVVLANTSFGVVDSYEWRLDGDLIGTDSLPPLLVYDTEVTDTVELCLTAANSCESNSTCQQIIFTPASVTAFFRLSADTVCVGDTVFVTNLATAGIPIRYDFGNGELSDEPQASIVYQTGGTYRIAQRAFGCGSGIYYRDITVRELPTATFEVENSICPGAPVTFVNRGSENARYRWDFGDGSVPRTEASPQHTFAAAGTYEVCLTVTSSLIDGCSSTVCREIIVSTGPTAGFTATDTLCLGTPVTVTSQAVGDKLFCTYKFGDGGISTECGGEYLYGAAGIYQLTQTVTDARGCTDSAALRVAVLDSPDSAFEVLTDQGCGLDTLSFRPLGGEDAWYTWDFGDGGSSSIVSPTHIYADTGSYTVRLTARSRFCTSTTSQRVRVGTRLTARIDLADATACPGTPVTFGNGAADQSERQRWQFGDGSISFEPMPTHAYAAAGSYRVRLVVESATGCVDSTETSITVNASPAVDFKLLSAITCNGDPSGGVEVTPTSGTAPFDFRWSNGTNYAGITGAGAGTYSVTVTGAHGCSTTDSTVLAEPPPIDPVATITSISCAGSADGSIALRPMGGTPPFSLEWKDGQADSLLTGLAAGTYTLTVTDGASCTRSFSYAVEDRAPLSLEDSVIAVSCFGLEDGAITLTELSGGVAPYRVTLTGPDYQRTATGLSRFDMLDEGTYLLEAVDANGCLEERDITITEPDSIWVHIGLDRVLLSLGDSVGLSASYNAQNPQLHWSPAVALSCTDCASPTARPEISQEYVVRLADGRGCMAYDSVFVEVDVTREVFLPNTFTPNGDGRNDVFRVRSHNPGSIDRILSFQIWDRGGMLVHAVENFEPNDPEFGWDGTFKGRRVGAGQYVYKVSVRFRDGFEKNTQGGILLIR